MKHGGIRHPPVIPVFFLFFSVVSLDPAEVRGKYEVDGRDDLIRVVRIW